MCPVDMKTYSYVAKYSPVEVITNTSLVEFEERSREPFNSPNECSHVENSFISSKPANRFKIGIQAETEEMWSGGKEGNTKRQRGSDDLTTVLIGHQKFYYKQVKTSNQTMINSYYFFINIINFY